MSEADKVPVKMLRFDGDKAQFDMRLDREADVASIKTRVKMELGLPEHEQLMLFKGRIMKDDKFRPLDDDELDDLIEECGEDGLAMTVIYKKKLLPEFLEREGLEEVNSLKKTGASALHRAARLCDLGAAEELLASEEFSQVDARDRSGQTALHTAASCRFREMCQMLLLSPRFNLVGAKDANGQNALHRAACWGDVAVCNQILAHRLFTVKDGKARDKLGHTALEYATDMGHFDAAAAIVAAYGNDQPVSPTSAAVAGQDPDGAEEEAWHDELAGEPGGEPQPSPVPEGDCVAANGVAASDAAGALLSGVAPAFAGEDSAAEAPAVSSSVGAQVDPAPQEAQDAPGGDPGAAGIAGVQVSGPLAEAVADAYREECGS